MSKGKSEPFECRNHIRVLQPIGDGERLYICGTNAHSPKDWVVYVSLFKASNVAWCLIDGTNGQLEPLECSNRIRILQLISDGERHNICSIVDTLKACNTNNSKDWVIYVNVLKCV